MKKTLYLPIDTTINCTLETPYTIKKGDILFFKIALFEKCVGIDLEGQTVSLTLKKKDNTYIERIYSNLKGNEVNINDLDIQATTCTGEVKGELQISDSTGQSITNTFTYNVSEAIADDILRKSEDDIKTLQEMRQMILKYETEMQAVGVTVNSIDAFASIKNYIDTNIEELKSNNSSAAANIPNLKDQNEQAEKNIKALEELGDVTELAKKVQSNSLKLDENTKKPVSFITDKIINATSNLNIKIIGDSITCGNGGTGYICDGETIYGTFKANEKGHCWANSLKNYLEENYNCSVKNWGCGGTTSTDMVNHLSDLIKSTDDIILCAIGTNNRRVTNGLTILYNDLNTIYTYVKNLGKDIIFLSNIPSSDTTQLFLHEEINSTILRFGRDNGIEIIPTFSEFMQYTSIFGLNPILFDGVHPNDKGYDILYSIIMKYLGFAEYNNFGKIQLGSDSDLNNCWDYDREYYTDTDLVVSAILNKPDGVDKSFNLKNIRCVKNSNNHIYCVQELTTRFGEKYIRYNDDGNISSWCKIITSENNELLSWGNYLKDTDITLSDNVNNYNTLIIAIGSTGDETYKFKSVRLDKLVNYYKSGDTNDWLVDDGYIKFTSPTTATIKDMSRPIRKIIGIKGGMF